jgi:hypothetical protein
MKPGDPSPRPPATVLADSSYKHCSSEQSNGYVDLVVFHCGTESYWMCTYHQNNDQQRTTWYEVRPEPVTVTRYRRV